MRKVEAMEEGLRERQPQPSEETLHFWRLVSLREFYQHALRAPLFGKDLATLPYRQSRRLPLSAKGGRPNGRTGTFGNKRCGGLPGSCSRTTDRSTTGSVSRTTDRSTTFCLDGKRTTTKAGFEAPRLAEVAGSVATCCGDSILSKQYRDHGSVREVYTLFRRALGLPWIHNQGLAHGKGYKYYILPRIVQFAFFSILSTILAVHS